MAVWLITCCPPYQSVNGDKVNAKAVRQQPRYGSSSLNAVNPTGAFTDDMWCRERTTIAAFDPQSKAHRE